jgi:rare lipoprotein A
MRITFLLILLLVASCTYHNPDAVVTVRNSVEEDEDNLADLPENLKEIYQKYQNPENLYKGKRFAGFYKIGNPYKIDNTWYHPEVNENYTEEGSASWYGEDFHAIKTANNEIFDKDSISAGHRTLPMPSIVKVTNLENDRSIYVRVNDRGPFFANRIIDLSEKVSKLLDVKNSGTAKVKVEYDKQATDDMFLDISHENYDREDLKKAYPANEFVGIAPKKNEVKGNLIYFVQLGALSTNSEAKSLLNDAKKKLGNNEKGEISVFESPVKQYYRVRLGPFSKLSDADRKLETVKKHYKKAIIVSENKS